MSLVFEWDRRKARSNSGKHRIGHSAAKHLLLVCFTEPEADHIRIISARRATRVEQRDYEEHVTN
ncbi:MAG: hypothetical protein ACLQU1_07880 [Bryobacteraceae bacterium]